MPDPSALPGGPPAPRRREAKAARKARTAALIARLNRRYPEPTTALAHGSAWELLVATILSAQSTDETVNRVTPELFRRYPTVERFAGADLAELEQAVHPTGFFRNKSRAVKNAAQALLERHGGEVPASMAELVALPGVGRKTANVVLGSFFGRAEGVVVDTHVGRLSRRLGLSRHDDPEAVEQDLMTLLPEHEWIGFAHRLIFFGREVCGARDPRCDICDLSDLCPSAFKVGRFVPKRPARRRAAGTTRTRRGPAPPAAQDS